MDFLFKENFKFENRTKHPARYGKENGAYLFFTSSNVVNKYVDEYDFDGEYLIIGDGGTGNCKYFNGKFSASDHNYVIASNNKFMGAKLCSYFLMKDNYKLLNDGFKGVGLKNVSKSYIDNIKIHFNDKYSQNEAVDDLDCISNEIVISNKILKEIDELVKSQFAKKVA